MDGPANLKFGSQIEEITSVLVENPRIGPNKADRLLELLPSFEIGGTAVTLFAADKPLGLLQHLLKRHRVLDGCIVFLQRTGWQLHKRCIDLQAAPVYVLA